MSVCIWHTTLYMLFTTISNTDHRLIRFRNFRNFQNFICLKRKFVCNYHYFLVNLFYMSLMLFTVMMGVGLVLLCDVV